MKVSIAQYAKTLLELTENKSQEEILVIVKKFALQLKKNGQLKDAGRIMGKFSELYDAANGIVVAQITTKYEIRDARYKQLEEFIKSKYNAKIVEIENIIDEKIGGGIVIKVGDDVLDGSVASQLNKLKKHLIS